MKPALALWLWLAAVSAQAADTPFTFKDASEEARYQQLTAELRCLVCQNQSLADSHADLAQDLRAEVYRMVEAGQSNQQIVDFLVARYGDFVLYRPPVSRLTYALWFGPMLLLAGAGFAWWRIARTGRRSGAANGNAAEDAAVAALTGKDPAA